MGVTGLWKLIESSGKPVPLETLENKVLAIDISIWLHQVVKGFQDGKGGNLPNAHLLGLFHRLCKLLYYRVKPVFIFDGGIPKLKRDTIAKRAQSRQKLCTEADRIQDLLIQNLVRDKIVQKALGDNVVQALISPSKQKPVVEKPNKDDMFKLPSIPEESNNDVDEPNTSTSFSTGATSDADSSYDEKNLRSTYHINLQAIDVKSDSFKNLPADVRHEILTDIKEMRKQSSWGRIHELPPAADDFSGFQMKRLLKRRQVQVSLEEAEKQMEGKSLTLTELETLMSEEGILKASDSNAAKRILSNENTRFLLVKDLKKAVEHAQKEEEMLVVKKEEVKTENDDVKEMATELGCEYEIELQKAIEMSLNSTQVYKDDDYNEEGQVKLNEDQRKELKTAADTNSLARAYMLEYGGMNDDDIRNLVRDENNDLEPTEDFQASFNFQHNDRFILKGEVCTPYKNIPNIKEIVKPSEIETTSQKQQTDQDEVQYITSSSDDSDLEEVTDSVARKKQIKPSLEIIVDPTTSTSDSEKDDLFADVFETNQSDDEKMRELIKNASKSQEEVVGEKSTVENRNELENNLEIIVDTSKTASVEDDLFADIFESSNKSDDQEQSDEGIIESETKKTPERQEKAARNNADDSKSIKSPVVLDNNKNSAQDILDKLKDEMKKVQSITLDAIDVCLEEPSKTQPIEESVTEEGKDVEKSAEFSSPIVNTIKSPLNLDEILKQVKDQTNQVVKIQLDDINPPETKQFVINDSDDSDVELITDKLTPPQSTSAQIKSEIIEILDNETLCLKTPSKGSQGQSSINEFFNTEFVVKKTPEKNVRDESPPPQVTPPFFVNKSSAAEGSSNSRKRTSPTTSTETITPSKAPKVAKQLFPDDKNVEDAQESSNKNAEMEFIEQAAKILRKNRSNTELENIAGDIRTENVALEKERNRQSRMATSITDKMAGECQELLRLFGIPYIIAPMEAEAQCAFLDAIQLTDGTITDDSDVWLFGGRTVYKNFFNQKKHVLEFRMENIEKLFNMDRHKLIQLAMLVGSDYTTGINGIGAVTAIEILASFPNTPTKEGETTEIMSILSSLRKFRDWWHTCKTATMGARSVLRSKLKNVELFEGFPNMNIVEAYLRPRVDEKRERFTWGDLDTETICEFAKTKFGWTRSKTDEILQPVVKKLRERKTQATIKDYFSVKSATTVRDLKVSKRVMNAIDRMSDDYVETPPKKAKERKPRKKSVKKVTKSSAAASNDQVDTVETDPAVIGENSDLIEIKDGNDHVAMEGPNNVADKVLVKPKRKQAARKRHTKPDHTNVDADDFESGTSEMTTPLMPNRKKAPILPDASRPIPQREKDKKEMDLKKEKAIEIFKKKQIATK